MFHRTPLVMPLVLNAGAPGALSFHTKLFYVKSATICLRQPSRFNAILFAFPDHSRTEKF